MYDLDDPHVALRPDGSPAALASARRLHDGALWSELADRYRTLARSARTEQKWSAELRLLLGELAAVQRIDDKARTAEIQYFLALRHRLRTSFFAAEFWLHQVLASRLEESTAGDHARAWRELGSLREVASRYVDGLACVDRAIAICVRYAAVPGMQTLHAQALLEGSVIRRLTGDLAGARSTLDGARQIAGPDATPMLRGLIALRAGGLEIVMGRPAEALPAYRAAETIFEEISVNNRDIARVRQIVCLRSIPRLDEAAALAVRLANGYRNDGDDYRLGQVLTELAEVRHDQGDAAGLRAALTEAARIYRGATTLEALRWNQQMARMLIDLGENPIAAGDHLEAVLVSACGPDRRDLTRALTSLHELLRLAEHPGLSPELRRAVGRAALVAAESQRGSLTAADDRGSVQALREQVYGSALLVHSASGTDVARIMELGRADVLNERFAAAGADLSMLTDRRPVAAADNTAVFGTGTVAADALRRRRPPAEPVVAPPLPGGAVADCFPDVDVVAGIQLVARPGGWSAVHAVHFPGMPWTSEVREAGSSVARLLDRAAAGAPLPLRLIGERTWAELGALLVPRFDPPSTRPARILLSPDPRLWQLPYAALPTGAGALVDQADVCLVPSLHSAGLLRARAKGPVAGPLASVLDSRLPGHDDEFAALSRWPGGHRPVPGVDGAAGAALLYVSGHGGGPGGAVPLGPQRITMKSLAAAELPRTVVLNGCWSGSADGGYGRDPLSLAAGALLGGAATVVAGVGPIGGRASAAVGAELVRVVGDGTEVAEALGRAQRTVRDAYPEFGPMDWAGLIAVGLGW